MHREFNCDMHKTTVSTQVLFSCAKTTQLCRRYAMFFVFSNTSLQPFNASVRLVLRIISQDTS